MLHDQRRFADALVSYDAATRHKPDYAEAWCNRANSLKFLGRYEEAEASLERAIALKPGFAGARTNLATLRLLRGDFERGWRDFEWRKKLPAPIALRQYRQPVWTGAEDINGRTLFLYWEQGLGRHDSVLPLRPGSQRRAARRLSLSVPDSLTELLKAQDEGIEIIGANAKPASFDFHGALMSLPLAFKTTLESVPDVTPPFRADPAKVTDWRGRLGARRRPRVGLVWNCGFRKDQPEFWAGIARRNVPFEMISRINLESLDFHSLQKGEPAESEVRALQPIYWPGQNFFNSAHELNDFADTAALIDQLDLVITVDTAVTHLAGAMGKPVWLLLPLVPEWRWMLNREDSPWHPTVRLFRQTAWDDWPGVIARVRTELAARFA